MIAIFDKFPGIYCLRFGSIISGAIQSKLSARNEKSGETKPSSKKPKHQRGSFSFQGGMQVLSKQLSLCLTTTVVFSMLDLITLFNVLFLFVECVYIRMYIYSFMLIYTFFFSNYFVILVFWSICADTHWYIVQRAWCGQD